ncbi:hypothetical protein PHLGIDRAFT_107158 [Phlebiopsis gigantea 11061_1 CR5-6]|uniref:non-specific serine/threonine protein kinase n=1 Tax=Phlebiopsis gigantea (strain 11061_1 CR5-6) TaxID=745531 RepID=A0A0C3NMQ0_PHLG1|nr:hypothetical protein PHLGIDRAFT_107158 [Phlebiopsis gigantea 11061_1 CR5-6]
MADDLQPSTPENSLFALAPLDQEWRPILHASNQVVLYNPTSHALSIRHHRAPSGPKSVVKHSFDHRCPYCHRALPHEESSEEDEAELELVDSELEDHPRSRVPNYFQLLQVANETTSIPSTPFQRSSFPQSRNSSPERSQNNASDVPFRAESMAEGYFSAFFQEEYRLGMGANGTVYLCQHVLDGNPLGHFAVKKIAVGQSHDYLLKTLREVRLLEQLHHPNIIQYHHSWLESSQFSSFGPKVPTLHVLMQWAEGGSLDDFIDVRLGRRSTTHIHPASTPAPENNSPQTTKNQPLSRGARIRAFRAMQSASPEDREKRKQELAGNISGSNTCQTDWKAVHLLSAEEVKSLFQDVVEGLSFLHDKSILHLDLKPGNVLLTWDEGRLIPRAMLSDFGTSQDMLNSRPRSGNTGTLEYASPESLPNPSGILSQIDSKADMWSLGMILHKLLFFQLPYKHASDSTEKVDSKVDGKATMELLQKEVHDYPGFKSSRNLETTFSSRRLPSSFLVLLETLLHVTASKRPSSERVVTAIREGRVGHFMLYRTRT